MFSNRILISILFVIIAYRNSAIACTPTAWDLDGKKTEVCYDDKIQMMLSVSCIKNNCGARDFAKKIKGIHLKPFPADASKNPGSIYCKWLNGKVVLGRNQRGSQNAFCQASDGSLVDLSTLGAE